MQKVESDFICQRPAASRRNQAPLWACVNAHPRRQTDRVSQLFYFQRIVGQQNIPLTTASPTGLPRQLLITGGKLLATGGENRELQCRTRRHLMATGWHFAPIGRRTGAVGKNTAPPRR